MKSEIRPKMTALVYSTKTTLANLKQFGAVIDEIFSEAKAINAPIAGSCMWQYTGCDGTMEKEFDLDIILPIMKRDAKSEKFEIKEIPAFKCVCETFSGPWSELGKFYCSTMPQIAQAGFKFGEKIREWYLLCDEKEEMNCVTEVQFEIL